MYCNNARRQLCNIQNENKWQSTSGSRTERRRESNRCQKEWWWWFSLFLSRSLYQASTGGMLSKNYSPPTSGKAVITRGTTLLLSLLVSAICSRAHKQFMTKYLLSQLKKGDSRDSFDQILHLKRKIMSCHSKHVWRSFFYRTQKKKVWRILMLLFSIQCKFILTTLSSSKNDK